MRDLLFSFSALAALIPASLLPFRRSGTRDTVFWSVLAVAVTGPTAWALAQIAASWRAGLSTTLWVTIAASMAAFAVVVVALREAWRLLPLVAPYMLGLSVLATVWMQAPAKPMAAGASVWLEIHILVSVATYALVTVAAVAALAAFLQDRSLKRKRPTALTNLLPSVADCEAILVRLLAVGEGVLALGLATGMAIRFRQSGVLLTLDHKTVLTITAFLVIGVLLVAHYRIGVRGRQAARYVLLAYLLMTLGYPGVKFVTDVILN